jgi:hypothetical protein
MSKRILLPLILVLVATPLLTLSQGTAEAEDPEVTRIHMVEKKGYFEVQETLMNLEPGAYVFEVKNDSGKMVGFMVQDLKTMETLTMGSIEVGKTREYEVEISADGFRFRCPINPTPWHDVSVGKM